MIDAVLGLCAQQDVLCYPPHRIISMNVQTVIIEDIIQYNTLIQVKKKVSKTMEGYFFSFIIGIFTGAAMLWVYLDLNS